MIYPVTGWFEITQYNNRVNLIWAPDMKTVQIIRWIDRDEVENFPVTKINSLGVKSYVVCLKFLKKTEMGGGKGGVRDKEDKKNYCLLCLNVPIVLYACKKDKLVLLFFLLIRIPVLCGPVHLLHNHDIQALFLVCLLEKNASARLSFSLCTITTNGVLLLSSRE